MADDTNLHPGDKVSPREAGRLLDEQVARITGRSRKSAENNVTHILERTSGQALLKTFAALTHRMHAAQRKPDRAKEFELRLQRDKIEVEILRRMGGD